MHFIVILLFVAAASAAPSESLIYEVNEKTPILESKSNIDEETAATDDTINPLEEGKEADSSNRHKKSATTTFCVEVRPSDPYQKPYEICESGNQVYAMPIESASSSFGTSMSSSANRPYTKPTYSAPKPSASFSSSSSAFSASASKTEANYPKGNHYGSYRSGDMSEEEDAEEMDDVGIMMEDGDRQEMANMHPLMRSAGYGYGNDYGNGYGYGGGSYHDKGGPAYGGMSYVKFKGANKKGKGGMDHHHGLVITCQPSLAGYASPIGGGVMGHSMGGVNGHYGSNSYTGYRNSLGKPQKYRPKHYGPDNSGFEAPDGYPFSGTRSDPMMPKAAYPDNSLPFNNGAYYNPSGFNKGQSTLSTSSSSNFPSGPGYPHMPLHRDAASYPPPPTQNFPAPQMFGSPQVPIQPAYNGQPPMYNMPQSSNHHQNYNSGAPAIPAGFPSASTSSSTSYTPPGTQRFSENMANSSMMMKAPMEMKEKEMERTASMGMQDEKGKHAMENMNQMNHKMPHGMWNSNNNMRSTGNQGEHLQEEMKTEHTNGNSMTDNQAKKS